MSTDRQTVNLPHEAEQASLGESLDQLEFDFERTRQQLDRHIVEYEEHVRRTRFLWGVATALVMGLILITWLAYPYFSHQPALEGAVGTIGERMQAAEERIREGSEGASSSAGLSSRLAQLEESVATNFQDVRNRTQSMSAQLSRVIQAEVSRGLQKIQNRLGGVESIQRESQEHVAKLESEVASLRQELAAVRADAEEQLSRTQQLRDAQQSASEELTSVRRQVDSSAGRLDSIASHLNTQRKDFEISSNQTEQVAPGIYLTVRRADVAQQRIDGWVQIASEGRIIWIRGNGAQNPIRFVTKQDQRPHEIVFTRIDKQHVAGYVLAPA